MIMTMMVTPLHVQLMLACYVTPEPWNHVGRDTWNSNAGKDYRAHLKEHGLVDEDWQSTDRGEAWVRKILDTPLPPDKKG